MLRKDGIRKMKILSFGVPCYNSEAYMEKCIESLLPGGDDVEILIVDDGRPKTDRAVCGNVGRATLS